MLYLMWGGALFVLLIGWRERREPRARAFARSAEGAGDAPRARREPRPRGAAARDGKRRADGDRGGGGAAGRRTAALQLLGAINIQDLPRGSEIRLDGVVVAYTLGPVGRDRRGARPDSGGERAAREPDDRRCAKRGARARAASRRRALRRALVVTQVAFAFVLLVGAGLLFASFRSVLAVDPGFNADGVLTASISLPRSRYADDAALRAFHGRGAAAAARAAGRHRRRRDEHDSVRRQSQRQRHPRRGLPDAARRVGDVAEPGGSSPRAISRR